MASHAADPESQQGQASSSDGFPFKLTVDAADANKGLTLEQFRALVGMPQEAPSQSDTSTQNTSQFSTTDQNSSSQPQAGGNTSTSQSKVYPPLLIRPATITTSSVPTPGSRLFIAFGLLSRPKFSRRGDKSREAAEYATSLYFTLVREESDQARLTHFYEIITYTCLIGQIIISSILIILAAIPLPSFNNGEGHRIPIAVLGAVTGLLTSIMSLLKGQGLPGRLQQYGTRLRQLRDKLEFMERALRANVGAVITFQDVITVWNEFEQVRNEKAQNRPNVWTTASQIPAIAGLQQWSDTQTSKDLPRATGIQATEQQPLISRGNNSSAGKTVTIGASSPRDIPNSPPAHSGTEGRSS